MCYIHLLSQRTVKERFKLYCSYKICNTKTFKRLAIWLYPKDPITKDDWGVQSLLSKAFRLLFSEGDWILWPKNPPSTHKKPARCLAVRDPTRESVTHVVDASLPRDPTAPAAQKGGTTQSNYTGMSMVLSKWITLGGSSQLVSDL